jgi:hypothetical protein
LPGKNDRKENAVNRNELDKEPADGPPRSDEVASSDDGVDVTLIRWFLTLTPAERLAFLQRHVRAVLRIRRDNPQL